MADDAAGIARRLFDALESADVEALRALYAPDAVLWTNTTQRELKAREVASFLPLMARRVSERSYTNRRIMPCEGGFIHLHRLVTRHKDGSLAAAECCAVVRLENGMVARIDEYLDSRQLDASIPA